jgi:hypothetical protein
MIMSIKRITPFFGSAAALVVSATMATSATIQNFDFGMVNMNYEGSNSDVSVWAAQENIDGQDVRYCVLSAYKSGRMQAYNGENFREAIANGSSPQDAVQAMMPVDRDSYRANVQYIVVADANDDHFDFVRIQGGAPLVEGETTLYIDGEAVPAEILQYEDNEYTVRVTDPTYFDAFQEAMSQGLSVQAYFTTQHSDLVLAVAFEGGQVANELDNCQTNLETMDIQTGVTPHIIWGAHMDVSMMDVVGLLGQTCGYQDYTRANEFGMREIDATQGMFIPDYRALTDGDIALSADYMAFNFQTGELTVSRSMEQFNTHSFTSCMGSQTYTPETSSITAMVFESAGGSSIPFNFGTPVTPVTWNPGTPGTPIFPIDPNDPHDPIDPRDPHDPLAPIPLPMSAWLLLAGVGTLGVMKLRRKSLAL